MWIQAGRQTEEVQAATSFKGEEKTRMQSAPQDVKLKEGSGLRVSRLYPRESEK